MLRRVGGSGEKGPNAGPTPVTAKADSATEFLRALPQAALNAPTTAAVVAAAAGLLARSRLRAARVFVSMQALNPTLRARTYLWEEDTGQVRAVEWPRGLENRPGYYESPDRFVHRTGSELRVRRPGTGARHRCDLYETLRAQGYTDYLIVPLRLRDGTLNTLSIATREAPGFRDRDLAWFRSTVPLFTVILERHAAFEALDAVLDAYLGRGVGQRILRGQMRAGDGELIEAAILMTDLDDFTRHAARLDPAATVRLLNDYFDCLGGPIDEHGGHILKFIGDAVLAFFPMLPGSAAPAPLQAAIAIRRRLAALNATRTEAGEAPLRHALCLNYGCVLYGNIGSRERLDFTIIGEAVNLTARGVEAAKGIGVEYFFTAAFVALFGAAGLAPAGNYTLRGVAEPVAMLTFDPAAA